ncbi:MAG: hypothetical protein ONB16_03735 [candidate division KSB1 bacterium]|nr:hypothetical protein [candidate division KSB1 bacterium]MDZ7319646.1 hypothetical protein [candidate division KSB1 bacterium]
MAFIEALVDGKSFHSIGCQINHLVNEFNDLMEQDIMIIWGTKLACRRL